MSQLLMWQGGRTSDVLHELDASAGFLRQLQYFCIKQPDLCLLSQRKHTCQKDSFASDRKHVNITCPLPDKTPKCPTYKN